MNPNKKIPNSKNNPAQASPWLLCPSKSFPGKFYYFNGSTGETAWCISETDKNLKKGPIHRVTDKAHPYPEPFYPPDESPNTTTSFSSLKNPGHTDFHNVTHRPSPLFGQAVFPRYVQPDFAPKFVWTLTPMFMPNQIPQRHTLDQIQTYEEPMFVPSNPFQPLKTPFMPAQNSTQFYFKDIPMFDQASNFTSKEPTFAKPQMKDEACQTFVPRTQRLRTKLESNSTPKSVIKASRSVENRTLLTKDVETSTLSLSDEVENGNDKLNVLDKNDLRFKLEAKRMKECTVVGEKAEKLTDQSKATKTQDLQKKRVTFNFQEPGTGHAYPEDDVTDQSPDSWVEEPHWFVVTDTETLLSELQCIEEFVKSDASCRLLVPHGVYSELESRSRGDSGAISARQLLRKLAAHENHIIVQRKPEYVVPSENSILECCWNLLQEDCHVILVTNNQNISNKAKSIDLECYTVEEIRMDNEADPVPQNDPKTVKIVVDSDNNKSVKVGSDIKKSENLFMQDFKQVNGLCLTKPNGFTVRPSRMNIFDRMDNDNVFGKTETNSDKLIDLTRPKNLDTVLNSELSNVKNQIVKLSITERSPINNRTKQIMKNVLNKMDQETKTFGPEKHKQRQQSINDKNNVDINQNQKSVPNNIEIIDETDLDIRRLNVMEHNQEKSRDSIRVSGITKLNKQFNLDDELERFYVKNSIMETRIKSRLDEWVCRLNQTMEEALTDLLLNEKAKIKRMMPPWNLFEAIQVTGETYKTHTNLKQIVGQFSMKLLNVSSINGNIKKDIKPIDFMNLVGFSVLLIENLKEIVKCKELYEADERLNNLIKNIEDPKTDIDLPLEKVNTPVFSGRDISDSKAAIVFRKSRTEIIEYLRKHFEAWRSEADMRQPDDKIDKEPNILITCGKNLNTLKIYNTRAITVENNTEKAINNVQTNNEKNIEEVNVNNQPKVIRNVKIIEAFEERLKNRKSEKSDSPEHNSILEDLPVSESSADTECVRAYPLVKIFLVKVKSTLIRIFNFINTCIHEYRNGTTMDRKADMKFKTELSRQYLLKMAERLKNIIARESGNGITLKQILIKAGDYVEDDGVMANYKETVTKFLQQAQILEEILGHMLPLFNATSPKESDGTYCTSFNTPSPILPTRSRSNVVKQVRIE